MGGTEIIGAHSTDCWVEGYCLTTRGRSSGDSGGAEKANSSGLYLKSLQFSAQARSLQYYLCCYAPYAIVCSYELRHLDLNESLQDHVIIGYRVLSNEAKYLI